MLMTGALALGGRLRCGLPEGTVVGEGKDDGRVS